MKMEKLRRRTCPNRRMRRSGKAPAGRVRRHCHHRRYRVRTLGSNHQTTPSSTCRQVMACPEDCRPVVRAALNTLSSEATSRIGSRAGGCEKLCERLGRSGNDCISEAFGHSRIMSYERMYLERTASLRSSENQRLRTGLLQAQADTRPSYTVRQGLDEASGWDMFTPT